MRPLEQFWPFSILTCTRLFPLRPWRRCLLDEVQEKAFNNSRVTSSGSPSRVNMDTEGALCRLVPRIQTVKRQAGYPIWLPPKLKIITCPLLLSCRRQKACRVHMLRLDGCSRLIILSRNQQMHEGKFVFEGFVCFLSHICNSVHISLSLSICLCDLCRTGEYWARKIQHILFIITPFLFFLHLHEPKCGRICWTTCV